MEFKVLNCYYQVLVTPFLDHRGEVVLLFGMFISSNENGNAMVGTWSMKLMEGFTAGDGKV